MPGSAILPATIINGKLYFLFGKENKFEKSAPGFSDFGGGMEKGEKPYEAAIREACEEMTGFLGNEKEVKSLMEKHGTYKVEIENYTSFIFPLQYDPQLVKYYNNNQRFLLNPQLILYLDSKALLLKLEYQYHHYFPLI